MKRFLLSCLALSLAAAAPAQQPATPAPVAKRAATPPPRNLPGATEKQILEFGSFELPRVQQRSPKAKGGNFLLFTSDEWVRFKGELDQSQGTLTVGLTNEVARTGRQAMYVEFDKLKKPGAIGELSSQLIPIMPDKPYHVAIWGRMDKKRALTLDQRIPSLGLQLDFFQADGETQTGDQVFRVQPMPGSPDRPAFFISAAWHEYWADFTTPEDAAFLKITWRWTTPPKPGETNGIMYFDDATLFGEKVPVPEEPPEPEPAAPGTPAAPVPGADPVPAPAPK